jgi:hypothetical protein
MKKLWYLSAFALIVVGVVGLLATDWKTNEDLPSFEKKWTFESASLNKLTISSDYDVDITFVRSTDGTNSISLKGAGKEKMIERIQNTEISNQSLQLNFVQTPKRFINFFNFDFRNTKEELIISVKDDVLLDTLALKLDSGHIRMTDATNIQLTDVKVSLDSGNLTLNNFKSTRLDVEIDSGSFKGDQVTAELTAEVDSGNIELKNTTGTANISVDSGFVKLYKLDTNNTDISVDSGTVYVEVPSSFAGYYDLKVDSGTVNAPDSKRDTKDYIKVRVDSGMIKIDQK